MNVPSSLAFLVVAGGRGVRAGAGGPKQYRPVLGKSLLSRTLEALHAGAPSALLQIVTHADDSEAYEACVAELSEVARRHLAEPAEGGASRQESVRKGLEALAILQTPPRIVLIHDAARPFADAALIERAIDAAREFGAAAPGVPIGDTIKEVDAAGRVVSTPERARLRGVQTPQAFSFDLILAAHRACAGSKVEFTDDAMVAEHVGAAVHIFAGDPKNFKLTTPEDFLRATNELLAALPDVRVGQGFDVHAFAEGSEIYLGGVAIPHTKGLAGHSDADVLAHAITDAIFGGAGRGRHRRAFPALRPAMERRGLLDLPRTRRRSA